ncbi:MAG: prolyl oligopeptidase family serine peptidase [Acidobacteriota bacterium]
MSTDRDWQRIGGVVPTMGFRKIRFTVYIILLVLSASSGRAELKDQKIYEEITFKSSDGLKIYGYLYRPSGKGPFPAIVRVHGGVHGQARMRDEDFFVNNGYVVCDVDYRGSDGHGKDYRNRLAMGDKEVDDVIAAGKFLQTLSYVRKDKIAVTGDSRGAYITYCAVARPSPFKAAVAVAGFTDLVKQYEYEAEISPHFQGMQKLMGGSPYTAADRFKDLSPVHFAGKINVPVLVLHGNNDRLVLPEHSWDMANKLFENQKEHDIIVLYSPEEDTGHNIKGKALEVAHQHMLNWFNKYLFPDTKKK